MKKLKNKRCRVCDADYANWVLKGSEEWERFYCSLACLAKDIKCALTIPYRGKGTMGDAPFFIRKPTE